MRSITAFLLLTLVSMDTAKECSTPLFRDIVSTDETKTQFTLDNIGETDTGFVTGLPLINSSDPLTIRVGDFTTPTLLLARRDSLSPHYWLTALDLQQGPAGQNCWSSGVAKELSLEVKEASGYRALNTPFREGWDPANSNPTLNLIKLGGAPGRTVRLSFQPMGGDGIRIKVLSIDPLSSSVTTEVCLRVEVYGCEKTGSTAPTVNSSPLYQYNLAEPSAEAYGTLYRDTGYSGIVSGGYQSGGTGILTDGTVGASALGGSEEWVGWSRNGTREIEVLFLFKERQEINRISLYFWEEEDIGIGSAGFTDQSNNTILFETVQIRNVTESLRELIYTRESLAGVSYVKLRVFYSTYRSIVLLTEIEMVTLYNGNGFNVITERNISQLVYAQSNQTTTYSNSTNTEQTTTTTTTTTPPTTTTNSSPNQTFLSTTTTNNNNNNNTTSPAISTPVPTHTITTVLLPGTECCNTDTILLMGVSGCLTLSFCLNSILLLSLAACCWRCIRGRGTFQVQGRDYDTGDPGTYVPMSSLQLPSYHNILETDTGQEGQEDTLDSDSHYYSVIEAYKDESSGEAGKYYQFK